MRLLALLSVLVPLAFAAAGCGGGGGDSSTISGTKPETWATTVCGALQAWKTDLNARGQKLSSDIRSSNDVKSVKQKVIVTLRKAEQNTAKLIEQVNAAGTPAVKDGPAIQRDLASGLAQAHKSFQRALAHAKKLPTNNSEAFIRGLAALPQFSSSKTNYDLGELDRAMADEPACKPFVSSS